MVTTKKPLWECPACGQRFVTPNAWHSCGYHAIDEHFHSKGSEVRGLFDALLEAAREIGPVYAYAQKTRIVFQTRARFVAVTPRKRYLAGHLWLKRPRPHPRVHRIESLLDRDFIHNFRLTSPDQLDESFRDLLREAYHVGCQEPVPDTSVGTRSTSHG